MPLLDPETLARLDRPLRPWLVRLPAPLALRLYSRGRRALLDRLTEAATAEGIEPVEPPGELGRTLWGVRFRSPLGNAAGMFKNGRGYALCARQGAGYYLAGTTTAEPREGNRRAGVRLPFAPYPRSGAASNWLGLPNEGHAPVAERLARIERVPGCPVGASLAAVGAQVGPGAGGGCPDSGAADPGGGEPVAAGSEGLLDGLARYADAGVDFLEINESCPNTEDEPEPAGERAERQMEALRRRLEAVAEGFFAPRRERPPVVVKFSVDTDPEQVGPVVDLLLELGFDGVDFGNTSTGYRERGKRIDRRERRLYDRFTETFGGGVSGRPLREASLELARRAVEHVRGRAAGPGEEERFHVVRTGGSRVRRTWRRPRPPASPSPAGTPATSRRSPGTATGCTRSSTGSSKGSSTSRLPVRPPAQPAQQGELGQRRGDRALGGEGPGAEGDAGEAGPVQAAELVVDPAALGADGEEGAGVLDGRRAERPGHHLLEGRGAGVGGEAGAGGLLGLQGLHERHEEAVDRDLRQPGDHPLLGAQEELPLDPLRLEDRGGEVALLDPPGVDQVEAPHAHRGDPAEDAPERLRPGEGEDEVGLGGRWRRVEGAEAEGDGVGGGPLDLRRAGALAEDPGAQAAAGLDGEDAKEVPGAPAGEGGAALGVELFRCEEEEVQCVTRFGT